MLRGWGMSRLATAPRRRCHDVATPIARSSYFVPSEGRRDIEHKRQSPPVRHHRHAQPVLVLKISQQLAFALLFHPRRERLPPMVLGCLTRPPVHALSCPPMHECGNNCMREVPQKTVDAPAHARGVVVEVEDLDGDDRARSLSVDGLMLSHATVLRSELLQELLSLEGTTNVSISIEAFQSWHNFSQSEPYSPASLAVVLQVCRPGVVPAVHSCQRSRSKGNSNPCFVSAVCSR